MKMTVKILGAGLSGLSCAINLAGEHEVLVYEKQRAVGEHIFSNLQGFGSGENVIPEFFASVDLPPPKNVRSFKKVFFLTHKRDLTFTLPEPYHFVVRGGSDSLEADLYEQAIRTGVEVSFNSSVKEEDVDVVASGAKKADVVGVGGLYSDSSFPDDSMLIMFDDRFSPKGWYFYMIPRGDGLVEAINCVPSHYASKAKELLNNSISKRPFIKKFMDGAKLKHYFSGYGNAFIPKTACNDGRLYVGEAAGFQDPLMGFGMKYALTSGYLAAKSIKQGLDYDLLWQSEILPSMKSDIARRFLFSLIGSSVMEYVYKDVDSGQVVGLPNPKGSGFSRRVFEEVFYRLGCAKKRFLGYW